MPIKTCEKQTFFKNQKDIKGNNKDTLSYSHFLLDIIDYIKDTELASKSPQIIFDMHSD